MAFWILYSCEHVHCLLTYLISCWAQNGLSSWRLLSWCCLELMKHADWHQCDLMDSHRPGSKRSDNVSEKCTSPCLVRKQKPRKINSSAHSHSTSKQQRRHLNKLDSYLCGRPSWDTLRTGAEGYLNHLPWFDCTSCCCHYTMKASTGPASKAQLKKQLVRTIQQVPSPNAVAQGIQHSTWEHLRGFMSCPS